MTPRARFDVLDDQASDLASQPGQADSAAFQRVLIVVLLAALVFGCILGVLPGHGVGG